MWQNHSIERFIFFSNLIVDEFSSISTRILGPISVEMFYNKVEYFSKAHRNGLQTVSRSILFCEAKSFKTIIIYKKEKREILSVSKVSSEIIFI